MTLTEQVFAILDVKVHCMLNPHGSKFNCITILKLSKFFRILQYHPFYHSSEVQRHYCRRDVFYTVYCNSLYIRVYYISRFFI